MNNENLIRFLEQAGACGESLIWLGERDAKAAWNECPHPEWLLWIAPKVGVDHKTIGLSLCACARLALHWISEDELRPLKFLEATEAFMREEIPLEQAIGTRNVAFHCQETAYQRKPQLSERLAIHGVIDACHTALNDCCDARNAVYTSPSSSISAIVYAAYMALDIDVRINEKRKMEKACVDTIRRIIPFPSKFRLQRINKNI